VAVLKGEGKVPILFGSLPLPVTPNRSAYLARPDVAGSYSTVVLVPDDAGVTPTVKALARHLARHGYAVIAPVLRDDVESAVGDTVDAIVSARIPGTEWADGDRVAVVGIGSGGVPASIAAAEEEADALVLVGAALDRDLLDAFGGGLLVLHGADDESAPADEVKAIRQDIGRGEFVLYGSVGGGFFDDASETHDPVASSDVFDRIVTMLDTRFGAVQVA
jgi:dienelactone hydrolase